MKVHPAQDALAGYQVEHPAGTDHTPRQLHVCLNWIEGVVADCCSHGPSHQTNQRRVCRGRKREGMLLRSGQAEIAIVPAGIRDGPAGERVTTRLDGHSSNRLASTRLAHRTFDDPTRLSDVLE